jgi:hypothetical protein
MRSLRFSFGPRFAVLAVSLVVGLAAVADDTLAKFEDLGEKAIAVIQKRAAELNIKGVGVVAYAPGETVTSWTSKMVVVGNMTVGKSDKDPGSNLLAIVYSKASEMAETLKNSGSKVRAPMKGEFGWQGGVIARGKNGWLICAFSGGKSEDDVKVSEAALEVLSSGL